MSPVIQELATNPPPPRTRARWFFDDRSPLESLTSCQHDVGCGGGGHMRGARIAQGREIEAVPEMLAGPEQPWRDRHVQLVDEPRFEVLADRRHTAADLHILSASCRRRSFQRLADTARDKVEDRAAFHLNRRAVVMRQHKYRPLVPRGFCPPPAPPRPRAHAPEPAAQRERPAASTPRRPPPRRQTLN